MIVTEVPCSILSLDDSSRPPGLHVSDIISAMLKKIDPKRYDKRQVDGTPVPMNTIKIGAGLAVEQALEQAFKAAGGGVFRPDPIFVPVPGTVMAITNPATGEVIWVPGGIWCSPDGLDPEPVLLVREFKLTWYSAKRQFPDDPVYAPYLWQVKGYAKACGVQHAAITILWVVGDYPAGVPSPFPPRTYGLTFETWEIEENWIMLINNALALGLLKKAA